MSCPAAGDPDPAEADQHHRPAGGFGDAPGCGDDLNACPRLFELEAIQRNAGILRGRKVRAEIGNKLITYGARSIIRSEMQKSRSGLQAKIERQAGRGSRQRRSVQNQADIDASGLVCDPLAKERSRAVGIRYGDSPIQKATLLKDADGAICSN